MEIIFAKQYLKELHILGKTSEKKYRFQPNIIKRYRKTIDRLAAAKRIEDLYIIQSMKYEKLTGDRKGISSVRVSDKYRIEFEEKKRNEEDYVSICNIVELSNHYK
jgi:proteic killer suppression protein